MPETALDQNQNSRHRIQWKPAERKILITELCELRVEQPTQQFLTLIDKAQGKLESHRRRNIATLSLVKDLVSEFDVAFFEYVMNQRAKIVKVTEEKVVEKTLADFSDAEILQYIADRMAPRVKQQLAEISSEKAEEEHTLPPPVEAPVRVPITPPSLKILVIGVPNRKWTEFHERREGRECRHMIHIVDVEHHRPSELRGEYDYVIKTNRLQNKSGTILKQRGLGKVPTMQFNNGSGHLVLIQSPGWMMEWLKVYDQGHIPKGRIPVLSL